MKKFVLMSCLILLPALAAAAQPGLDRYAGYYQLAPRIVIQITRDGDHLVASTGPQKLDIFPQGPGVFAADKRPLTFRFDAAADGKITGLTLQQNGHDTTGARIGEAQARAIAALPHGHPMARTWPVMAGIAPRVLTAAAGTMDYWPCFSPDGKTVLFSRTADGGKSWALFRVPAAGGEAQAFANLPVSATRADWSAQGNLIAFTGTAADGSNSVWVMNPDDSGAHALTAEGASKQLFYPSWYPDGKSLAVMDGAASVIRRLDVAGGAATAVTERARVLTGMPSVSPDGKWIAFAGQKNNGQAYDQEENVVWLAGGDGALRTLETPPLQGRAPVWSPDGRRLAFESDRGSPDGHYAIFLINRDGSGLTQVTDYALDATHPVFSPDGRQMVFASHQAQGNASVIEIAGLP